MRGEALPELLGVLVNRDHPEVVRLALARLPGVADRRPRVAQGTVQHAHHALGVDVARRSCGDDGETLLVRSFHKEHRNMKDYRVGE